MSIPAGHIITVGGLNVLDRLQDVGLQNPKVPTETVREVGNDLVVGKILTEADFSFQLTSWDVGCDLMALLTGKKGSSLGPEGGPSAADIAGTAYQWQNCQMVNFACPWARDTGSEGGHITSGVIIPAFYPTALAYKFGVTENAEMSVTLSGGEYYQADAPEPETQGCYPLEEWAATAKAEAAGAFTVETSEVARPHRIGGFGSEKLRHVFGVLVNGIVQQEGVDYAEEGGAKPGEASTKVKIKFIRALPNAAVIHYCYFSDKTGHVIGQAVHASTAVTPAAVRGRNIEVVIGPLPAGPKEGVTVNLRGVQTLALNASTTGSVQREMGTYNPIGYNVTGIDTNGSVTIDPKEEGSLYDGLEAMTGISRKEVMGFLNERAIPLKIVIYDPKSPSTIIKSIRVGDAKFQLPGETARVNTTLSLPISFESEQGSFEEVKGE